MKYTLSNTIEYREKWYRCETTYDEQIISYLKDYPISIAQFHKKHNYEIHRTTLNRKLKTFKDPVIVNSKPCWITRYGSGLYFTFYDNSVGDYITIKNHDDESTKAILRLAYPDYSEFCIGKVNTRLWCRYLFVQPDVRYPEAGKFYAQQE